MTDTQYAGMIKTPEAWWMSTSKAVYDAWDLPDCPLRDLILDMAERRGVLHRLGPGSMTTAQAAAAAMRVFGAEITPDQSLAGFEAFTQRGHDFVNETGEFAPDYTGPEQEKG